MRLFSFGVLKKISLVAFGNVAGQAFAFVLFIILASVFSKTDYGQVRYVIGIATVGSAIVCFGLPTTLTYFLSRYRDDVERSSEYLTSIVKVFLCVAALASVTSIFLFKKGVLIALTTVGLSVPIVYLGVVRGRMKIGKYSSLMFGKNGSKLVIIGALILLGALSVPRILLVFAFGGWIPILVIEFLHPEDVSFTRSKLSREVYGEVFRFSSVVLASTLAFTVCSQMPLLFLGWLQGTAEVAVYSVALTLASVFMILPIAVATITMPKIAHSNDFSKAKKDFANSFAFVAIFGIIFIAGAFLFGRWTLHLLFGEEYMGSYMPLVVLSLGAVFMGLRNTFGAFWQGCGKPSFSMYDAVVASIVAAISSIILIPKYGIMGAAMAYSLGWAATLIVGGVLWMYVRKGDLCNREKDHPISLR